MTDISPEQPVFKEGTAASSWKEIRAYWQNSPYSEHYEAAMQRMKIWESKPGIPVDEKAWNTTIGQQIAKAKGLLETQRLSATMSQHNWKKVFAIGRECPPSGQEILTRVYIGVDPRKATDAYVVLLDELEANGVLKDIEAAINIEELMGKKITDNMIVLYEPLTRTEVLDGILAAYRNAKQKHPDLFNLSDGQKATVMRGNLRQFHAVIDANASFVEVPKEGGGRSFDTNDGKWIQKAFGIPDKPQLTDEGWLRRVRLREVHGVVFSGNDQYKMEKGLDKPGDTLHIHRRLTSPALVQYGTVTKQ